MWSSLNDVTCRFFPQSDIVWQTLVLAVASWSCARTPAFSAPSLLRNQPCASTCCSQTRLRISGDHFWRCDLWPSPKRQWNLINMLLKKQKSRRNTSSGNSEQHIFFILHNKKDIVRIKKENNRKIHPWNDIQTSWLELTINWIYFDQNVRKTDFDSKAWADRLVLLRNTVHSLLSIHVELLVAGFSCFRSQVVHNNKSPPCLVQEAVRGPAAWPNVPPKSQGLHWEEMCREETWSLQGEGMKESTRQEMWWVEGVAESTQIKVVVKCLSCV